MRAKGLFDKPLLTEEEFRQRKKRHLRRRVIVYGGILAAGWAFFVWVPWNIDLIEHRPNPPLPLIDPDTKKLFGAGTKILLITAHPDDSEFYIGGTLLKLGKTANIHQIICTDGDKSYYWIFTNAAENRRVRHEEAEKALRAWGGKSLQFLGYPDGRLRASEELISRLETEIRNFQPDYIFCFDPEYPPRVSHQDHRRAGEAAYAAAKRAGIGQWLMMFSTNGSNWIDDVSDVWDKRLDLLKIHSSQWAGNHLTGVTNSISDTASTDAERANFTYGEGFRCVRIGEL